MDAFGRSAHVKYVYRGTTEGWPGNMSLQDEKMTPTTTDPLVATLFAIECRNHGPALILAAPRSLFEGLIGPANYFSVIESAVNLEIFPMEFAIMAKEKLDVDQSIAVLHEMGFQEMPVRLSGSYALQRTIDESYKAGLRLSEEQIRSYNSRMFGTES